MPVFRSKVEGDGKVQLPSALMKRLKIRPGVQVEFFLTVDGQVHFHAITGTAAGFGGIVTEVRSPPISIREIDDAIAEHVSEKFGRKPSKRKKASSQSPAAAE